MDEPNPDSPAPQPTPPPAIDPEIAAEIRRQMLAEQAAAAASATGAPSAPRQGGAVPPAQPGVTDRLRAKGGIWGVLATILAVLAKAKGLLAAAKFFWIFKALFITGGSMFLSMWAYATRYGWLFGAAMVLMIFLHECGHAFAGHLRGKPWGIMMFIPFMGAFVTVRGGDDVVEDAFIGIAGPLVGTFCGLVAWAAYGLTGAPFWLALAWWTFFINLFNLAPVAPLDGGWIVPLFSPRILALTAILLIPLGFRNPLILVLALSSLPRIIAGWNVGKTAPRPAPAMAAAGGTLPPQQQPWDFGAPQPPAARPARSANPYTSADYFHVRLADKWRYGLLYFGLIAFLGFAVYETHSGAAIRSGYRARPHGYQVTPVQ